MSPSWIVMVPQRGYTSSPFTTEAAAEAHARETVKNDGQPAFVLAAVARYTRKVTTEVIEDPVTPVVP